MARRPACSSPGGFVLLVLALLLSLARCGPLASSTYIYSESSANLTFTVTAAADTNDLFFKLSAPGNYDWIAVGFGATQMKGAVMFVAYPTKNGTAITLSPRLGTGHTEPAYDSAINAYLLNDPLQPNHMDANKGDQVMLSAVCRNCTQLSSPPLDLGSTAAPFMWALGPINTGTSIGYYNSPAAPLRMHSMWSVFTVDMKQATVPSNPGSALPALGTATDGASVSATVGLQHNFNTAVHGLALIVGLVVIIPVDIVVRMCIRSVKLHMIGVVGSTILFIAGIALGFVQSPLFLRSKRYNSPHQIMGILIIVVYVLQIPLGIFAERRRRQLKQRESQAPPTRAERAVQILHSLSGWAVLFLAVVDAGLGFNLALTNAYSIVFIPTVLGIFVLILIASGVRYMWRASRADTAEELETFKHDRSAFGNVPGAYAMHDLGRRAQQETQYENVSIPGAHQ